MRPNILLVHSDQHRFDCIGVNGHPQIQTPHLDRLAAGGMNFTQAFCPIPLCVPARNCLLNGQWPTEHLAITNYDWVTEAPRPAKEGLPTFSQTLRDANYRLGYVGKWHVHPERDPRDYGFHDYVPEGAYADWRLAHGLPPQPSQNRWFGELDPQISPQESRLAWGADQTIRLLRSYGAQQAPFFIRWDPSEPHLPNVVPEPYYSLYPPADIPPWLSFPDPLIGKPYIQAQQRRTWGLEGWGWDRWAPIVSRYLGEITLLDAQIGRILNTLDELGAAENTLVIYTSDHGDMCGGHGMIDKHFVMYDDVTHVPLIARWPGRIAPASQCNAFVSHSIDLASTFCDVAKTIVPETFRGRSLVPLFAGATDNGRQTIFATYHGSQFGLYSQRMVRDHRWKYVWNATAEDELYDLDLDPGELNNQAVDAAHQDVLIRLRHGLVTWMEETRDGLLNPWTRAQLLKGVSR